MQGKVERKATNETKDEEAKMKTKRNKTAGCERQPKRPNKDESNLEAAKVIWLEAKNVAVETNHNDDVMGTNLNTHFRSNDHSCHDDGAGEEPKTFESRRDST